MQIPTTGPGPNRTVVPFPVPQVPQVYLAMAAAQMHAEGRLFQGPEEQKVAQAQTIPQGTPEQADTWEKIISRNGRSDMEILKTIPKGNEVFTMPGKPNEIFMRKNRPSKPVDPKDLVS